MEYRPFSMLRPVSFLVKKWILVVSILVNIAYLSLLIYYCPRFAEKALERYYWTSNSNRESGSGTDVEKQYSKVRKPEPIFFLRLLFSFFKEKSKSSKSSMHFVI